MTTTEVLTSLSDIVADLSRELPPKVRFQRLLDALMSRFPCDATALLQLEGEYLVPRAVRGLSPETMGRRFLVKEQPEVLPLGQVQYAIDKGYIDGDTLLFNNLVGTKADLQRNWLQPLKFSWLKDRVQLAINN